MIVFKFTPTMRPIKSLAIELNTGTVSMRHISENMHIMLTYVFVCVVYLLSLQCTCCIPAASMASHLLGLSVFVVSGSGFIFQVTLAIG